MLPSVPLNSIQVGYLLLEGVRRRRLIWDSPWSRSPARCARLRVDGGNLFGRAEAIVVVGYRCSTEHCHAIGSWYQVSLLCVVYNNSMGLKTKLFEVLASHLSRIDPRVSSFEPRVSSFPRVNSRLEFRAPRVSPAQTRGSRLKFSSFEFRTSSFEPQDSREGE